MVYNNRSRNEFQGHIFPRQARNMQEAIEKMTITHTVYSIIGQEIRITFNVIYKSTPNMIIPNPEKLNWSHR